jgi:hypothetical protein
MSVRLALASAALLVTLPAADAAAVCKPRAELVRFLATKFKEHQRSFGLQNDLRVLEIFASADGSWTALLSMPNGMSCVVSSGEAWTTLPPAQEGEPT